MKNSMLAFAAFGMMTGAGHATAGSVAYTATETATGSLGGSSFTDAAITQKFTGDTSNITSPTTGVFRLATGTLTISVTGFSTATVQDNVAVILDTNSKQLYFSDLTTHQNSFFLYNQPALASYNLATSIGPLGGSILNQPGQLSTDQGTLKLDSHFQAPQFTATTVPEPSTLVMCGTGVIAAIGYLRRSRCPGSPPGSGRSHP